MENNNLNELEQLKAQYETLKQQFDQQEIVNKRLMKSAIQTNFDFFERNRKVAMFVYPIIAVLMYIYLEVMGFRTSAIILVILMAIATFVELWLTRNTRQHVVDNSDLLTLSQNMQKLKTGYSIYVVIWLFVCFVFAVAFTFQYATNQGITLTNAMWVLCFMGMLLLVFGIVAYRTFVGHCNNVIRQIDAIEGRPTTKKNMTFWYFMGSLTALIVVGLLIFYQLLKPTVYTRAENDMNTAGTLEFKVLDVDTMVFDNEGKPIINSITFNYRKNGESTLIIVRMTPEGGKTWYQFTTAAQGHNIGLFLDGELVQKYYIQNAIDNGHFYLNTDPDWSKKEVEDFCKRLIKN
jgi:predicted P-loop ATPase/GTPase